MELGEWKARLRRLQKAVFAKAATQGLLDKQVAAQAGVKGYVVYRLKNLGIAPGAWGSSPPKDWTPLERLERWVGIKALNDAGQPPKGAPIRAAGHSR